MLSAAALGTTQHLFHAAQRPFAPLTPCPPRSGGGAPGGVTENRELNNPGASGES
jgi:hypothetical protein